MKSWKDNVRFVLVEPREAGNIGACARAMKNMGFHRLCLVNPVAAVNDEAHWFARHAVDVLGAAEIRGSLGEAIADAALVVGTTRRKGRKRGVFVTPEDAGDLLRDVARHGKVALLFGREDRGLFNDEVEECGLLLAIPASREQPSLNLSHAVLLVAYELSRARSRKQNGGVGSDGPGAGIRMPQEKPPALRRGRSKLASHAELTALYARLTEVLTLLEYLPQGNRDIEKKMMANIKHFIGRAGMTAWELKMLHGIVSRIEKKLSAR